MGGKNAFIVFGDADLDAAVSTAFEGAFFNKGEACTAASRLLVHSSLHGQFVERLGAAVEQFVMGNGMDPATHVGPCVSRPQQQKVLEYIRIEQEEGAEIVAEASLPKDPACKDGFFVPPTVLEGITRDMRIAREEMFGPVVTVASFESEDEAILITNESAYGLTAILFTRDMERSNRVARRVDVGMGESTIKSPMYSFLI